MLPTGTISTHAPVDYERLVRELQDRLAEAEETLRAIRAGEVDAVVATGPDGDHVYTLKGADEAYRLVVQQMGEGAATLTRDGLILFANERMSSLLNVTLELVTGQYLTDFVVRADRRALTALLHTTESAKCEVRFIGKQGLEVPVQLSAVVLRMDNEDRICLVATDLTEQKRNENIVASERLARSILEQAAEAVVVVDPRGRIVRASRAADWLSSGPVLLRDFDSAFILRTSESGTVSFKDILAATLNDGPITGIEARIDSEGAEFDVLVSASCLAGEDLEPQFCIVTLTDVTKSKRRESQLKFQAEILRKTHEAVIAVDANEVITFWNSGAERLYGVPRKQAIGSPLSSVYKYTWENPSDEAAARAALNANGTWVGENIHVRNDGSRIFVNVSVSRLDAKRGGGMFAVVRDVTEEKRAGAAIRASERRERSRAAELQSIMEAVPAAVLITHDSQGRVVTGNRMAHELFRLPPDSDIPSPGAQEFRLLRDGRVIPFSELPVHIAARSGKSVNNSEVEIVFGDNDRTFLIGHAVPLVDDDGLPAGAVAAFIDVTDRKVTEDQLRQTQKLEGIGLLAGGIAHDFNNLLIGIIGNASLAQEMLPEDDPAAELVDGILTTGEQLAHLTRQLLAYAGKGQFVLEPLSLTRLVPEMKKLVQPLISKKIRLRLDLSPAVLAIEADRGQLQQVFLNLVLNAAEACGAEGGVISIATGTQVVDEEYIRRNASAADLEPGTYYYLEVGDTGCGISETDKARIFDPFFSTKFSGRGLGLAAVAGIVRGHRGGINVASSPEGSTFTVLFPSIDTVLTAPEQSQRAVPVTQGTVLVVDDEEVVRMMTQKVLARHGLTVLVARDGREAIDIAKRSTESIDVVVLDVRMPGLGGEEILPELRKARPNAKVVVSSGCSATETMALFGGQRISGFLPKPYTSEQLVDAIITTFAQAGNAAPQHHGYS